MPPYDTHPALGHPEVAAWALRALGAPEAEAFWEHLASCSECQGAVAEFEAVTRALEHPVPADEPPSDLEARTVAAVQYAAMTANRPGDATVVTPAKAVTPANATRWWHRHWNARPRRPSPGTAR